MCALLTEGAGAGCRCWRWCWVQEVSRHLEESVLVLVKRLQDRLRIELGQYGLNQSALFLKRQIHKPCYESKYNILAHFSPNQNIGVLLQCKKGSCVCFGAAANAGTVQKNKLHVFCYLGSMLV